MRNTWLWALVSGLGLSLGWPAHGFPFLLWIALVPLLFAEHQIRTDSKGKKGIRVFIHAYLAFVIWNALTTWWIWNSTAGGALVAILCNAAFMALAFTMYHLTFRALGEKRAYVGLVMYWIGYEHLHLDWDLSWPWLQLGNGFAGYPILIQWYEWVGVMGGSLWILAVNLGFWHYFVKPRCMPETPFAFRLRPHALFLFFFLILPSGWSVFRYLTYPIHTGEKVEVVALQPNLDPYKEKFEIPSTEMLATLIGWSKPYLTEKTRYLVWPETALPFAFWEDRLNTDERLQPLRDLCTEYPQLRIFTGAYTLTRLREDAPIPLSAEWHPEGFWMDDHNTGLEFSFPNQVLIYHKSKLVPGPEMTPFPQVMKPIQEKWFGEHGGMIGAMAGQKERTVFSDATGNLRVAPVICYESIYGDFLRGYVQNGANVIAISTNDAWWGNTPGHRQLLSYTQLRAIELRRDIIRSANTGISCLINARGDVLQPLPYLSRGAVVGNVHLHETETLYSRHGDFMGGLSVLIGSMLFLFSLVFRFLKK